MTYQESIDYLFNAFPAYERNGDLAYKPGLGNVEALSSLFNHPHKKLKTIHIAGTNGKGSSAHLLAAAFHQAGYKVGLYTSPHIFDFCERIKINGLTVPKKKVVEFVELVQSMNLTIPASFFELTTMLAFQYFEKEKVDVAIIETGLGGRLDATNIISPVACLITNIGLDHTHFLGNSISDIAFEKAGIIKSATPVVISERQAIADRVFTAKATKENAPFVFASDECEIEAIDNGLFNISMKNQLVLSDVDLALKGNYQSKNLKGVVTLYAQLKKSFKKLSWDVLKLACKDVYTLTGFQGRWQEMRKSPKVIQDAAHNEDGIKEAMMVLKGFQANKHIILGFSSDKDINKILPLLIPDAKYYFCAAHTQRAMPADKLKASAAAYSIQGDCYDDVNAAIQSAIKQSAKGDVIWVGGSLYLLGEIDWKQHG
ncbi:MAG: folylpolyglutamate synthase/dihydrofolate synthase family protein [Cytophagaceae bacterium]